MLALDSEWTPALGAPLLKALASGHEDDRLNFGCVAAQGYFDVDGTGSQYEIYKGGKPVVAFLFKLISQLQFSGTVPMIDVQAYAKWLSQ